MSIQYRLPVLITRPIDQARRLASALPNSVQPVISPLLSIEALPFEDTTSPETVFIFTSQNGVKAFSSEHDAGGRLALCVGQSTTRVARVCGFDARMLARTAGELVDEIAKKAPAGQMMHIRGEHSRGDVASRLRQQGFDTGEMVAYRQKALDLNDEARQVLIEGRCLVPLFSPRTARLFAEACPEAPAAELLCLSENVSEAVRSGSYSSVDVVETPSGAAMFHAIIDRATG